MKPFDKTTLASYKFYDKEISRIGAEIEKLKDDEDWTAVDNLKEDLYQAVWERSHVRVR